MKRGRKPYSADEKTASINLTIKKTDLKKLGENPQKKIRKIIHLYLNPLTEDEFKKAANELAEMAKKLYKN